MENTADGRRVSKYVWRYRGLSQGTERRGEDDVYESTVRVPPGPGDPIPVANLNGVDSFGKCGMHVGEITIMWSMSASYGYFYFRKYYMRCKSFPAEEFERYSL